LSYINIDGKEGNAKQRRKGGLYVGENFNCPCCILVVGIYRVPFIKVIYGPENILEIALKSPWSDQGLQIVPLLPAEDPLWEVCD
jgi:hypothetical protein